MSDILTEHSGNILSIQLNPVWVGMGWLATKSGEVPQSKH